MNNIKNSKRKIDLQIKSIYRDLSKKEKMIADYFLETKDEIENESITEMSNKIGVADSTLYKFVIKLGFKGFTEFKISILTDRKTRDLSIHEKIVNTDNELEMAKKIFDSNIQTLIDSKNLLDLEDLKKAGELIQGSTILNFFGLGASGIVAEDGFHKFLRSPIRCQHSFDFHNQLLMASLMKEKDCAILISHSGITEEALKIASLVKLRNAKLILITSYPQSEIAKSSDCVFVSSSEETAFRSEALSSRITQLSILDSLYVITMFKDEDKSYRVLKKVREAILKTKVKSE